MIRFILFFILLVLSCNSFAVHSFYATQLAAQSAMNAAAVGAYQTGYQISGVIYNTSTPMSNFCNSNSAHDYYYYPAYSTPSIHFYACTAGFKACPNTGETRNTSGVCVCPSGQTVVNGSCQVPVIQDCPTGQYKLNSVCTAVPDCNAGVPGGGAYFAVALGSCQTAVFDGQVLGCSNSSRPVACPPYDDCIATGAICSDNQADAQKFLDDKLALTPASKATAAAAAAQAESAKNDATAAAAAKAAAAVAAQQNSTAAQSAAASGTPEAINQAAAAAIEAAKAATKAANAAQQKSSSIGFASEADAQNGLIPSNNDFPPGRAQNAADRAQSAASKAVQASLDAIAGNGDTPGIPAEQSFDCPDCAKESTLNQLMQGTGNDVTVGDASSFDDTSPDDAATAARTAYQTKFNQVKSEISQLFTFDVTATSALPVFDFGEIKGVHVVVDFNRWAIELSYFGLFILFYASVVAVRIILE